MTPFTSNDLARLAVEERLGRDIEPDEFERMLDFLAEQNGRFQTGVPAPEQIEIVQADEFADVDEPGAGALVGSQDAALIAEDGDVMVYGDGGAGKTTLMVDLAFHLAAGRDWLGINVERAVNVILIENEGPRPMFRRKLKRKLEHWGDRDDGWSLRVLEQPWGEFSFASEGWRQELSLRLMAWDTDVLIVGPLTRIGMDEAGTLQEVRRFTELIADLRRRYGRKLAVILVHHENKAGSVSGAWEGAGDTILHVEAAGNGHTILHVQKARWDAERHGTTMKLAWADGDAFSVEGDRDYLAEIKALLSDRKWRTARNISAPKDRGGIGANLDAVKDILNTNLETFEARTGDAVVALGFPKNATAYMLTQRPESAESAGDFLGGEEGADSLTPPLRESASPESPPLPSSMLTQGPESAPPKSGIDYAALRGEETAS